MKFILLAGGSGERLWPLSRTLYPKSLLKKDDGKSALQNTYEIILSLTSPKNIITVINVAQETDTRLQLKNITANPVIISEPMTKNTAPAAASALTYLKRLKRDEVVVILPVDFVVSDKKKFIETIENVINIAKKGYIGVIGTKALSPEIGFGYIKTSENLKFGKKIEKFIEKPNYETAQSFVSDKSYYWNCGIYSAKVSVLNEAYNKYAKDITACCSNNMIDENLKINYLNYEKMPDISLDYAIIEKADNLVMTELNTKWSDIGSWHSIYNEGKKDKKGNVITGNVLIDKVENSLIYSSKELVCVSGMKNVAVVETEDAVLVCDKSRASEINKLVKVIKKENEEITQIHKTVFRPWGYYTRLNSGKGWLSKIITVLPSHKLSLQSHNHRSEHWVVLEGNAVVITEGKTNKLTKGQSIDIPVKSKHSLQNPYKEVLKILEVQKGDFISEDDIIRYEDMYGRVKTNK